MNYVALASLCALQLVTGALAQGPIWTEITPANSPGAHFETAMAYDSTRGKVVMFGGNFLNDTWEFDGVDWMQVTTPSSPGPRSQHAMAYDAARGKVVMFGGFVGGISGGNDTWEYDGVTWTQAATGSSPSGRGEHAMVYDAARGRVVMFGGFYGGVRLNDTWEFDGSTWTQITTPNSANARSGHGMAYDAARGKVVMFGGLSVTGFASDTWEYDGVNWTLIATANSPSARQNHGMAYDSGRGKVVMSWGQHFFTPPFDDTWEWDGVIWTQTTSANGLVARVSPAMAYDAVRGKVVAFGGFDGSNHLSDTLGYGVNASASATYGTGCGMPALDFSPTANPVIGTTASALISNAPTALAGVVMGWSASHLSGVPLLPLELAFIGMPGCSLLNSNDVFGLPVSPVTATTLQFDYPVPFHASLLGAHVYLQAYCVAPGENSLQIVASNGIDWLIGDQ